MRSAFEEPAAMDLTMGAGPILWIREKLPKGYVPHERGSSLGYLRINVLPEIGVCSEYNSFVRKSAYQIFYYSRQIDNLLQIDTKW